MPLYRTAPDVSIDDLLAQIEASGEELVGTPAYTGIDWVVFTRPARRPETETR